MNISFKRKREAVFSHSYDLITEKLLAYPAEAKYIQIEKNILEDFIHEYEALEDEMEELK